MGSQIWTCTLSPEVLTEVVLNEAKHQIICGNMLLMPRHAKDQAAHTDVVPWAGGEGQWEIPVCLGCCMFGDSFVGEPRDPPKGQPPAPGTCVKCFLVDVYTCVIGGLIWFGALFPKKISNSQFTPIFSDFFNTTA